MSVNMKKQDYLKMISIGATEQEGGLCSLLCLLVFQLFSSQAKMNWVLYPRKIPLRIALQIGQKNVLPAKSVWTKK